MEGRVQEHRVLLVGVAYKSGSLVSISVSSRFSGDTGVEYRLLTLPCRFRFRPRILCLLSFPSVPVENKRNEQEDKNEGARDRGGASVVRRMTASPNRPVRCIPPPLFYPRSARLSRYRPRLLFAAQKRAMLNSSNSRFHWIFRRVE